MTVNFSLVKTKHRILSLGAESAGGFAVYDNGKIFISENFEDILEKNNFTKFKKAILKYIKTNKPDTILTDLHPLYNSTIFGNELSKKLKIPHLKVQHQIAHIFSAVGDYIMNSKIKIQNSKFNFIGIASDGTGYGLDGNIWGGEIFKFKVQSLKSEVNNTKQNLTIEHVGSLEEQIMIGGDLAVREPARMIISILSKFLPKEKVYLHIKKYYTKNEFELLYNQLQQNFNCQKTTSTGRILDAVSVFLGFADNKRDFKHEAAKLLEKNSTSPCKIAPKIIFSKKEKKHILSTTPLFEYLNKNITKDRKKLAATAQQYIAEGFWKIVLKESRGKKLPAFFAGGMANNKIISSYLENQGVYVAKKIPRGDEGIAFGQIVFYLCQQTYI